jgi:hypothetical protein
VKYSGPARIQLIASPVNVKGTIKKVRFYADSTLLHTETKFPYGSLWDKVPEGTYHLTAIAYDDKDNEIRSNSIVVSVVNKNIAPVVSIVSPVNDTVYAGPATMRLIAKAKDPNDKISKVEFYSGKTLIATEYNYPYTYTWTNVSPGIYTIKAVATDDKGLSTSSRLVTVTVAAQKTFMVNSTLNSSDRSGTIKVKIWPNPTTDILRISINKQYNNPCRISLQSASGVLVKTINVNASNQTARFEVSSLASGVYIVKVAWGNSLMFQKFVKL